MYKELIISIVILVLIFSLDYFTQKYTDNAVKEISDEVSKIQEEIKKEEIDNEKAKKDINRIYEKWLKKHDTLAYFIEHNELEKVETEFTAGKSYIESKQYYDALCDLEKTVFILEHINEKYSFNLENIFWV